MVEILAPISPGDLIDRLTILRIKSEKITSTAQLANIRHQQRLLQKVADTALPARDDLQQLWAKLYRLNGDLWVLYADISACESRHDHGPAFVGLVRAARATNDQRAELKREINMLMDSKIIEEKAYGGATKP